MEISISDLCLSFKEQKVLNSLSFTFSKGNYYLLQGDSGCGKSSLLRILVSLHKQDSGQVKYNSKNSIQSIRRQIQFLPQLPVTFPGSVKDNLLLPFEVPGYKEVAPSDKTLNQKLNILFPEGIDLKKEALSLSQGQKQRLALCRALLLKPSALLCDEPTSALDTKSRKIVDQCIKNYFAESSERLIIYVSHHEPSSSFSNHTHILRMSKKGLELVK